MTYRFDSDVWRWESRAQDWFFATVPAEVGEEIAALPLPPRGFGSVPVSVTIGATTWTTSIFPSGDSGVWSLPLKKAVRDAERFGFGDTVSVALEVIR
ncbi:MAG TPA: DUF1905 domain-containing protein [Microbacterium sp.]|nr:DUF1905 domain-containing protein [Microbacterium sp.]